MLLTAPQFSLDLYKYIRGLIGWNLSDAILLCHLIITCWRSGNEYEVEVTSHRGETTKGEALTNSQCICVFPYWSFQYLLYGEEDKSIPDWLSRLDSLINGPVIVGSCLGETERSSDPRKSTKISFGLLPKGILSGSDESQFQSASPEWPQSKIFLV